MNILIAHLGTHYVNISGGVEKATCEFANAMIAKGHEVSIIYIDNTEGNPYFPLSKDVRQFNILFHGGKRILSEKLPSSLRFAREVVRPFSHKKAREINAISKGKMYGNRIHDLINMIKPDVIISCSISSTKYIINDAKANVPVIQMVHDDPPTQFPTLSQVEILAARKCAVIQVMLDYAVPTVTKFFPNNKIVVIGLPVYESLHLADPGATKIRHVITSVGNLSERKNQMLLVKAFAEIADKFPDWQLEIWGNKDSTYGKKLEEQVKKLGMDSCIHIMGPTHDVSSVYQNSDIFAIPSKLESFSLSLSEAMAAGLPAVGFKNCNGVNSLIQDEETGFLVDYSINSFNRALSELMKSAELRSKMGKSGKEYIKRFEPTKIWNQWDALLHLVVLQK